MAASSSSSSRRSYDVFLSFRGEDTRNNFTAHLCEELRTKGINTFIDEEELERGQDISPALITAIENSMFSIVVLSENYTSSKWCLEELVKIVECMKSRGQRVVPIFYNVDPSDVRNHMGNFGEALAEHEENFKENMERVQIWKHALTQVTNLSGWDSRNKNEPILIKQIVKDILNKLLCTTSSDTENLVGIDARIQEMEMLLCLASDDVRMVGIWGMGGIGKTTLARAVYSRISYQFEGCSFLENVVEDFKKKGLIRLQVELLSHLLEEENLNMKELTSIKARLHSKKVLIVLDNVNDPTILECLIGNRDWFGRGSRIIITTRDKRLLLSHKVDLYEVRKFNDDEALEFLAHYSLKHGLLQEDFQELSRAVICYAQSLPLALKVLGSFLFSMSKEEWRDQLDKLKSTPDMKIHEVLKISYDGLDFEEKNIFLDIACFLRGEDKNYVKEILDYCDFFSVSGIRALTDKSLISFFHNRIMMHDLIQGMGMEIVRQESPNPSQRSRLWLHKDISDALEKNTGNAKIEGIFLDLSHSQGIIDFSTQAFPRMNKLRLLKVYESNKISRNFGDNSNKENCKAHFSPNLRFCYDELRYLYLYGYSLKSLDNGFSAKNLVHLSLHCSHIKRLWKGIKVLEKLKVMDLSHSKYLTETPDFSGVTSLEQLVLEGCISLHKVHPSLGVLNKLNFLSLKNCEKLKSLPSSMCDLKSLETFILSGCSRLKEFPLNFGNLEMLKELHADGTAVRVLPSSFSFLRNLEILSFRGCKGVPLSTSWLLPRRSSNPTGFMLHHLSGLCSLTRLNLGYCNLSDETNLSSLCLLSSLEVLDLSGNNFVTLPNIRGLSNLQGLLLQKCKTLQVLPELPSNVYSLIAQDCISLKKASNQVLKSLLPTTKSPKKTFKHNSGAHLIYVMIYGSRIPDWIRYQSSGCEVEADLPPNWFNSNLLGLALSFVTYVFACNVIIPVSYTLRYSTSSYVANRITIRSDKEGVGLDHVWLLYIKLPLFSDWHTGDPINWHQVTHISVSFGTQVTGWYPPIKSCGFDLVYSNDQDVNPPEIQFNPISSPPPLPPNKSTVVLKEIHEQEEPSGSGWSNVDGSESDSSDYHTAEEEEPTTATATDCSEDHSESEMRPQKCLKGRHYV